MNSDVKIALGSDHAGFELKNEIVKYLDKIGIKYNDFGTYSDKSTDYPDYAHLVADAVESGDYKFGIVACGSGNGVNMVVNKHQGIRSALCWSVDVSEIVRLHNDANICALPARFIDTETGLAIVDTFLKTGFEGGRHQRRINKIPCGNTPSGNSCCGNSTSDNLSSGNSCCGK